MLHWLNIQLTMFSHKGILVQVFVPIKRHQAEFQVKYQNKVTYEKDEQAHI